MQVCFIHNGVDCSEEGSYYKKVLTVLSVKELEVQTMFGEHGETFLGCVFYS